MSSSTSNYTFTLPAVASSVDEDLWGGYLNTNWTNLDAYLNTRTQSYSFADYELSRPLLKDYAEKVQALSIASNVLTLDIESGNHATVTLDDDLDTLTISNPAASGNLCSILLKFTQDGTGGRTITYPASFKWVGGTDHVMTTTAGAVDIVSAFTFDGGTTWFANIVGQNYS